MSSSTTTYHPAVTAMANRLGIDHKNSFCGMDAKLGAFEIFFHPEGEGKRLPKGAMSIRSGMYQYFLIPTDNDAFTIEHSPRHQADPVWLKEMTAEQIRDNWPAKKSPKLRQLALKALGLTI